MKKKLILLFLAIIVISCSEKDDKKNINGNYPFQINLDSINRPTDTTSLYFPYDAFQKPTAKADRKYLDSMQTKIYSHYLYKIEEPILSAKFLGKRMYRFFSGDRDVKSIRLTRNEDSVEVVIKYLKINFDFSPNTSKPVIPITFRINLASWDSLTNLAKKTSLWKSKKIEYDDYDINFIIEGHSEYGYSILGPGMVSEKTNLRTVVEMKKYFEKIERLKRKH